MTRDLSAVNLHLWVGFPEMTAADEDAASNGHPSCIANEGNWSQSSLVNEKK